MKDIRIGRISLTARKFDILFASILWVGPLNSWLLLKLTTETKNDVWAIAIIFLTFVLWLLICFRITIYPSLKCDESCYYHCTKGGQQKPECLKIKHEKSE